MLTTLTQALHVLAERFAEWRRRERARAELTSLDDRSLADIGLTRAEIPFILSHRDIAAEREATAAPANSNHIQHAA